MVAVKDADFSNVDGVFCCLPHGTTQVLVLVSADHHILNLPIQLELDFSMNFFLFSIPFHGFNICNVIVISAFIFFVAGNYQRPPK